MNIDLSKLKTAADKIADLHLTTCAAIDAERAKRAFLPIEYAGAAFDADATARERISGMTLRLLRGDGLPVNWLGWRDADNAMHWSELPAEDVQTQLSSLSRAIEDREQALLIAAWQHKAAVRALTDIDAVRSYDVSVGWPG